MVGCAIDLPSSAQVGPLHADGDPRWPCLHRSKSFPHFTPWIGNGPSAQAGIAPAWAPERLMQIGSANPGRQCPHLCIIDANVTLALRDARARGGGRGGNRRWHSLGAAPQTRLRNDHARKVYGRERSTASARREWRAPRRRSRPLVTQFRHEVWSVSHNYLRSSPRLSSIATSGAPSLRCSSASTWR